MLHIRQILVHIYKEIFVQIKANISTYKFQMKVRCRQNCVMIVTCNETYLYVSASFVR